KTNQIYFFLSSCDGRIKPSQIISVLSVGQVRLLDKNRVPLSALSFVTRNCIRKLHLQSVEIFVFLYFFVFFILCSFIFIISHNFLIQPVLLFVSKRRSFTRNGIQQQNSFKRFLIRIVNHSHFDFSEFESV